MNISADTKKSLGYLGKSLKMTKRAVEKNALQDGTTAAELIEFKAAIDILQALIDKVLAPVTVTAPVIPTAASVGVDSTNGADLVI